MLSQKNYLSQVALIESECEPRKKTTNLPVAKLNRSPIRDRENKINLSNMVSASGISNRSGNKATLSPFRRKCETSLNIKPTTNRKKAEMDCTNHPNKTAKYLIESEEETMLYCEKCAILLASQGFKVSKLGQTVSDNSRKNEVEDFLNEIQVLMSNLLKKQNQVESILSKGWSEYESEVDKIQSYYTQFYQLIDQHKRRVLQQIKVEFDSSSQQTAQFKDSLTEAVKESNSMKQDIYASMDSIILQAEQSEYRPVMDLYKEKLRKYRSVLNRPFQQEKIIVRKVCFKDGQELCQNIAEGITVEWEDENAENNIKQSVPEEKQLNPTECLEISQKYPKSSLKQIGNLFCSFDQ